MYAIVEIRGWQFKVTASDTIRVPKLEQEAGKQIEVKDVLLVSEGVNVEIGNPLVGEAVVKATVVSHGKGKKVTIFKKKRRKAYRVKTGHRQPYTELRIDSISLKGRELQADVKPAPAKKKIQTPKPKKGEAGEQKPVQETAAPARKTAVKQKPKTEAKKTEEAKKIAPKGAKATEVQSGKKASGKTGAGTKQAKPAPKKKK